MFIPLAFRCNAGISKAVSYTHLDVYKRQSLFYVRIKKTLARTLPAGVIVLPSLELVRTSHSIILTDVWSQECCKGPKSHQELSIDATIMLGCAYRVTKCRLKHPFETVFCQVLAIAVTV